MAFATTEIEAAAGFAKSLQVQLSQTVQNSAHSVKDAPVVVAMRELNAPAQMRSDLTKIAPVIGPPATKVVDVSMVNRQMLSRSAYAYPSRVEMKPAEFPLDSWTAWASIIVLLMVYVRLPS